MQRTIAANQLPLAQSAEDWLRLNSESVVTGGHDPSGSSNVIMDSHDQQSRVPHLYIGRGGVLAGTREIIEEMLSVAPIGADRTLSPTILEQLRSLTGLLIDSDPFAAAEYERFLGIEHRELDFTDVDAEVRQAYSGKRILVTGGTGCIGRSLLRQLRGLHAGPTFSVSRGMKLFEAVSGVTYLNVDVCDAVAVAEVMQATRPDAVFHLAAQRDPGMAERAVRETVMTNVIGTRNVLEAARAAGVERFVHASTGKAMRYYTKDTYAATKKLSEWLLQEYTAEGRPAGAARFTHVVDNSIVFRNMKAAIPDGIARIHDPNIEFYVQSAAESAQLLLLAGLNRRDRLRLFAIRDLGEPVRLLSMTLGLLGQSSIIPPVYFPGYDPGYEKGSYPGLYDPRTAGDLSPLINAIEADSAAEVRGVPAVDDFDLQLPVGGIPAGLVDDLEDLCRSDDPAALTRTLSTAGHHMALATYASADPELIRRLRQLAERAGGTLPCLGPQLQAETSVAQAALTSQACSEQTLAI